ncbi:hypothetical protein ACFLQN_02020 [Candidatus Aenigmatarchaeota archaeon]
MTWGIGSVFENLYTTSENKYLWLGRIKMSEKKEEKINYKPLVLENLLSEPFLKKMKEKLGKITAISLVFFCDEHKAITIIGHENPQEIKDKLIHIQSTNADVLKKITDTLDELGE